MRFSKKFKLIVMAVLWLSAFANPGSCIYASGLSAAISLISMAGITFIFAIEKN